MGAIAIAIAIATGSAFLILLNFCSLASANQSVYDNHTTVADASVNGGLSLDFYSRTCPNLARIVKERVKLYLDADISQAAGLLRLHFHDCFVQGCDASVLLEGSSGRPSEQSAIPNLSLRPEAFRIINDIKARVEASCPNTVSCADILTLASVESVRKAKGPEIPVPLGRRDSRNFASIEETMGNLPAPFANVPALLEVFASKGLNALDLVALSGGHTIGRAHCPTFANRLDPLDPNLDAKYAEKLRSVCPDPTVDNAVGMDSTPNRFDNAYFVDLSRRRGLFNSDSVLTQDSRTKGAVMSYMNKNTSKFFEQFSISMIKMSQIGVLTGKQGEIRKVCYAPNLKSVSEESDTENLSAFSL